ncbi:RNA-binding S4 domain-containing protein [Caenispirillum bisanense]|uniref:Heat shock protein Hsp15 n=1 Tax=Caenispirillum bisanense TaxID=414052 RepID=A0A286GGS6_9PROT|nr:RNA-binding S4 domain-containing protein [Caenispirillum bisanense]SOD94700.1 heat shock protein Hsp15 [Caenispirillum bisanense]
MTDDIDDIAEDSASAPTGGGSIRLDKWLWHARFCKTRSLAQTWCASGHVTVNGRTVSKPATSVKPGDTVGFLSGPYRRMVVVQAPGTRRGPASEAQTLYHEPDPPARQTDEFMPHRPRGAGRPTKKDRRALAALKGDGPD